MRSSTLLSQQPLGTAMNIRASGVVTRVRRLRRIVGETGYH
ncbi:hypothetical protein HMPREF9057_00379 [Actinomyces sp. oral taxon 171 str. F0337]|nr:hypothetical protein HMPREF9057_00379 [Actinomyces sp. oral taxon 171 str. F0337]